MGRVTCFKRFFNDPGGDKLEEGGGIYAVEYEMYWSTRGLEQGRVTVVNAELRTVYDFVEPEYPLTDYSTRINGITQKLIDIQEVLNWEEEPL